MPTQIDRVQLQKLVEEGAQLAEVLPENEYAEEHLPGAVHLPLKSLSAETASRLDKTKPVIVYCWDALCDMSPRAAWHLERLGFPVVYDYTTGKADWDRGGTADRATRACTCSRDGRDVDGRSNLSARGTGG